MRRPTHLSLASLPLARVSPLIALVFSLAIVGGCQTLLGEKNASPAPEQERTSGTIEQAPASSQLPFVLNGIPSDASPIEISDNIEAVAAESLWSFGGDFREIGSFPLDETSVFGSITETPDDVGSYAAALIAPSSIIALQAQPEPYANVFIEPQDGTGTRERLVWRAAQLSHNSLPNVDNWQVYVWNASDGKTRLLGSAQLVNGTDRTPSTDWECIPTMNESTAYFASAVLENGTWTPSILAFPLSQPGGSETEQHAVIATGAYPAAVEHGVIFATSMSESTESNWDALSYHDGIETTPLLTLGDSPNRWTISGVWASTSFVAVSFSSSTTRDGWIGVWDSSFKHSIAFIHTNTATVSADINNEWLVFGSASSIDNAHMYAYNCLDRSIKYLGEAPGYARPRIAPNDNVVLRPRIIDMSSPVVFDVIKL